MPIVENSCFLHLQFADETKSFLDSRLQDTVDGAAVDVLYKGRYGK